MNKTDILNHLRDVLTNLESAHADLPNGAAFILAAKDSLAAATQGVADVLPPHDNGVADVVPDPNAPSAQPGLADPEVDTSTVSPLADPEPVLVPDDTDLDDDGGADDLSDGDTSQQ